LTRKIKRNKKKKTHPNPRSITIMIRRSRPTRIEVNRRIAV
jgi:hypothetical protein